MMNGAMLLPEFDQEVASTRRMFDAIPDEHLGYQPSEKAFTLLGLATHVANLPNWMAPTLETDVLDLAHGFDQPEPKSMAEVVALFDAAVAGARPVLEVADAEKMASEWTLRTGDTVHFTMPKGAVVRSFILNHIVHHRAQIVVYLRLLGLPVPGMYGPSADEAM